jgi:hypothetical protein
MKDFDGKLVEIFSKLTRKVKEKNIPVELLFKRLDTDNNHSLKLNEFAELLLKID